MRRTCSAILLLAAGVAGLCCCSFAGEDDKPQDKLSGWQRLFRKQAAGYEFVVEPDEKAEIKLLAEPVLQWSQPVRGGEDGAVFVWLQRGRPLAMGTLFIWPMGNERQGISHELHSLSPRPLTATWRNRKWTPPKDSIVFAAVPGAPEPAASGETRLRQMRELTRQFQAQSQDKNDRKWELRLLPRPLLRYASPDEKSRPPSERETLDGALFGFVEGTDLEVVLLLEANKTSDGSRWEYALARMSDFRLVVTHREKTVWEVDRASFDKSQAAYYCSTVESRKSAEEE